MDMTTCQTCQHYIQHYAFNSKKIFRVYCGHCTFVGTKRKRPDTKACENYIAGPADSEAFVTKEYLSKELLDYMRKLDLLPQIEDASTPTQKASRK